MALAKHFKSKSSLVRT